MWPCEALDKILAVLWKRGEKDSFQNPDIRFVTRKQIDKAREDSSFSATEVCYASTTNWEVTGTLDPRRFMILKR